MNNQPYTFTDTNKAAGLYVCAACGQPLFNASKKFEAGCGFPSFWMHWQQGVKLNPLSTYGRHRTQLLCNRCGQHLGHLFPNKSTPSGVRYCISHNAIRLEEGDIHQKIINTMSAAQTPEDVLQVIRTHRSSEGNFDLLYQQLENALAVAKQNQEDLLASELQEVKEKYGAAYSKAKEAGGSAWPEFENFVTQFERVIINAKKHEE